jgi:hypothetical protein
MAKKKNADWIKEAEAYLAAIDNAKAGTIMVSRALYDASRRLIDADEGRDGRIAATMAHRAYYMSVVFPRMMKRVNGYDILPNWNPDVDKEFEYVEE